MQIVTKLPSKLAHNQLLIMACESQAIFCVLSNLSVIYYLDTRYVAHQCPGHGGVQEDAGDDGGYDDQPGPVGHLAQPLSVPGPEGEG